ncbi:jg23508 [Pararge aegeria aegeria]|uniref:Jg23508 protein n=1 Tax=Pararge aegeria aegeria TaxID=348720 RepID=A0A8S4RDG1_9NEOP|nr:jg23508 [Pararge aegeria aegeria]
MSSEKMENGDGVKNNTASLCGSNVKLRRELGLFSAINLILGVMIGSGIFVSPATALKHSGSVALCLIVWIVSGIISLLGALSFAELGTVVGKSGAEYAYFQAAFGKMHKFWGPLPSFICAWIYVVILRPAEVAIIVLTFANKFNEATKEGLSHQIKHLRERCIDNCNIIENSLPGQYISPVNVGQSALSYVEGLRTQIQSSETVIPTDENLIISRFVAELKVRNEDVEKLTAFTRAAILDAENEILRLESLTVVAEEALNKPRVDTTEVHPEQVQRAREHFRILKSELHGLIRSIFKDDSDLVSDITGQLMKEKLNEESNGYIQVTEDNKLIIEMLKDIKIVSENPYNNKEVKLAA